MMEDLVLFLVFHSYALSTPLLSAVSLQISVGVGKKGNLSFPIV